MFPRNQDIAPIGDDVYSLLHDGTVKEVYTLLRERMSFMVGNSVGFLLSGIALALGISSVLLLSSKGKSLSKRDTLLRAYTIALLFFVIAFQVQTLLKTLIPTIFFFQSVDERREAARKLSIAGNVTIVAFVGLTDGLLVWRCFMVQRVLGGNSSKWGNIFWIFPACLWIVTIAMAITASVIVVGARGALGYTANIALNLYAALFISVRLVLHRRMIMGLGIAIDTAQHIYIIGILLESTAINVPVTLVCAVGVGTGFTIEDTMLPIAVASQVLIIHQAAMGKALSRRREFGIKSPVEITERNGSRSPESTV